MTMTENELGEIVLDIVRDLDIAGAQVAVGMQGSIVDAAVGTANRALDLRVTPDTVFQIGSVTKLWTAVLMMQLVDAGLVDLDTPVTTYLPGMRLARDGGWERITPRHLMSMTSGLDNGPYMDTGRGDDALERNVAALAELPLIFEPGTAYGYSNASTRVSGLVIERVSGMTWDDAIRERIARPAGLENVVSLFEQLPYYRVAVGHHPGQQDVHRTWTLGRGMGPSGQTLAVSARDLVRFAHILLAKGVADDGARILSEDAVEAMHRPQVAVPPRSFALDWCLGPYRQHWGDHDVYGHLGTAQNGGSMLVWIPGAGVSLAFVINTPSRGAAFGSRLFAAVLGDRLGFTIPERPDPTDFPGALDPEPYLGRYSSFGRDYSVTADDRGLVLSLTTDDGSELDRRPVTSTSLLLPIGPHRFLAENDAVTWSFGWELAFTIGDDSRAALLHNGAWAARRVAP